MKQIYTYIISPLLAGTLLLGSCREDKELNLTNYPDNCEIASFKPAGTSDQAVQLTYDEEGKLPQIGKIERTYTIRLSTPLREDITLLFEPLFSNIPEDQVHISARKVQVPAGQATASVTIGLTEAGLATLANDPAERNFELGVNFVGVENNIVPATPKSISLSIKKEAYRLTATVEGEGGINEASFPAFNINGVQWEEETHPFTYQVKLDKPALEDIVLTRKTTVSNPTFDGLLPADDQVIIKKGEKTSPILNWETPDNIFGQLTGGKVTFTQRLTIEGKPTEVTLGDNTLRFNYTVVTNNIGSVVTSSSSVKGFTLLPKDNWTISTSELANGTTADALKDDKTTTNTQFASSPFTFTVDLKGITDVTAICIRSMYYSIGETPVQLSVSMSENNIDWKPMGTYDKATDLKKFMVYLLFAYPQKARYVKVEGNFNTTHYRMNQFYVYKP